MITYALIALNVAISIWGFSVLNQRSGNFKIFVFAPFEAARGRNLIGILLSHFSHADWWHLIINMLTLFFFAPVVERILGIHLLTIYAAAGLAATALIFILRRNNPDYRVLGASGCVSGILFAAIVLVPDMRISLMILPFFPIPAPIFALLYVAYTSFLLDKGVGNVSHEAHIGGAVMGFTLAGLLSPYHFAPFIEHVTGFLN